MSKLLHIVLAALAVLAAVSPAFAEDVQLVTGEVLKGTVVERTADAVVLDHPILGRLTIATASIAGGADAVETAPEPEPEPVVEVVEEESDWKWSAELGFSGSQGNTTKSDLHSAMNGVMENDDARWKLGTGYDRGENEGDLTKQQWYGEATRDFLMPDSDWFAFATGRIDIDDFQAWSERYRLGAGMGYQIIEEANVNVRGRAGVAGVKETDVVDDDVRTELILGGELAWKISEAQAFEASTTFYPDLEDSGEYRNETSLGWSIKLDTAEDLRLKVGVKNEYDSHRMSPFKTHDFEYYIALLLEF